jgi:hypothetical protein
MLMIIERLFYSRGRNAGYAWLCLAISWTRIIGTTLITWKSAAGFDAANMHFQFINIEHWKRSKNGQ